MGAISDIEKSNARGWYLQHGRDLVRCMDPAASEDGITYDGLQIWCNGNSLGTVVIAVCSKCRSSMNVTDYDSW